jgi:hypothetical protein
VNAPDGPSRFWSAAQKLLVVFLAIGAYAFVMSIDHLLGTHAPEVVRQTSGTVLFHLGPRYVPAIAPILAAVVVIVVGTRFWKRKETNEKPAQQRSRLSRIIRNVAVVIVLLPIVAILVLGVMADVRAYRTVAVDDEVVELRSVFATRRLEKTDIQRAGIHREETTHNGRRAEILSFEIVDTSGTVHRSWYSGSSAAGFEDVLERLEAELSAL